MTATIKTTIVQEPNSSSANITLGTDGSVDFQAGTASAPVISNVSDTNTGIFFPAADTIAFATNGTEEFRIGPAGQFGIQGANYGTSGQALVSGGASASPSWASVGGMTLLGTMTTTTGTSQSLSGLDLTPYKQVVLVFQAVSHNDATARTMLVGTSTSDDIQVSGGSVASTAFANGTVWIDLANGYFSAALGSNTAASSIFGTPNATCGDLTITNASTSISVAFAAGTFDNGSVRVYGVS